MNTSYTTIDQISIIGLAFGIVTVLAVVWMIRYISLPKIDDHVDLSGLSSSAHVGVSDSSTKWEQGAALKPFLEFNALWTLYSAQLINKETLFNLLGIPPQPTQTPLASSDIKEKFEKAEADFDSSADEQIEVKTQHYPVATRQLVDGSLEHLYANGIRMIVPKDHIHADTHYTDFDQLPAPWKTIEFSSMPEEEATFEETSSYRDIKETLDKLKLYTEPICARALIETDPLVGDAPKAPSSDPVKQSNITQFLKSEDKQTELVEALDAPISDVLASKTIPTKRKRTK